MARHHRFAHILPSIDAGLIPALILLLTLLSASWAAAEPPYFLGDLRELPRADGSDPLLMPRLTKSLPPGAQDTPFYFTALDDVHGRELWRISSTGPPQRLTDVCPGVCSSFSDSRWLHVATLDDGRAVFAADDGETGHHLWITDGTESGTDRLTPTAPNPSVEAIGAMPLDGLVYFSFHDRLWRTDGTRAGTLPFDDEPASMPTAPRDLFRVGDRIVFQGSKDSQWAFWSTDGTTPTATRLTDGYLEWWGRYAALGTDSSGVAQRLVFPLRSDQNGVRMASTDGTPGGTHLLEPLCVSGRCPIGLPMTLAGDRVAFGVGRDQVWWTDGTPLGTARLATLEGETWTEFLAPAPGAILAVSYYSGDNTLWRLPTSGSLPTTPIEVTNEFSFGSGDSIQPNGPAVFSGGWGEFGREVWSTDGTANGTRRIADLAGGARSSNPIYFRAWNDRVFFTADDRTVGRELYRSAGMPQNTFRAVDVRGAPDGSNPSQFVDLDGRVLFVADSTNPGQLGPYGTTTEYVAAGDLFAVNGTTVTPILTGRRARGLTRVGDQVFFVAQNLPQAENDYSFDLEPWITDGTPQGTRLLAQIAEGKKRSYARDAVTIPTPEGERILFFADQIRGAKVWSSDGTPVGTELLADLYPEWDNVHPDEACTGVCSPPYPPTRIYPSESRRLGDQVVFVGRDPAVGEELWITDGTSAGTHNLLDVAPGGAHSYPEGLVVLDDLLFFTTGSQPSDEEFALRDLWVTDAGGQAELLATDLGATLGMEALVDSSGSAARVAMLTQGDLDLAQMGTSLWVSDGSPMGTERLATFDQSAGQLTAADGLVYFSLQTEDGTELARSDGTAAGTFVVRDLNPGERGSHPTILATRDREVVFGATDGSRDDGATDLWISNGEPGDARSLVSGETRLRSPTAASFAADRRLFVSADDEVHGHEPWLFPADPNSVSCQPTATTLCLDGRFRVRVDWRVASTGATGRGRVVNELGTADTGIFWFFGPNNLELAIKILDGTSINDHHWLYYGALSDVQYTITAEDLLTGIVREYTNPSGNLCGGGDVEAFRAPNFLNGTSLAHPQELAEGDGPGKSHGVSRGALRRPGSAAGVVAEAPRISTTRQEDETREKTTTCGNDPGTLCLQDRFEVRVVWKTRTAAGNATPIPFSHETGMFWFFGPDNVELLIKILDGRTINDKFWVYYGALSDVEYTIRVVDTETGAERTWDNPRGNLCGGADVAAFDG